MCGALGHTEIQIVIKSVNRLEHGQFTRQNNEMHVTSGKVDLEKKTSSKVVMVD